MLRLASHLALRFQPVLVLLTLSVNPLLVEFVSLTCDLRPKINLFLRQQGKSGWVEYAISEDLDSICE